MFEPFLQLIPAAFHRVEFGKFRWKVPDIQILSTHARDRTVPNSFDLSLTTHELSEIARIEVSRPIKEHHQLFDKFLLECLQQANSVTSCETFFRPTIETFTIVGDSAKHYHLVSGIRDLSLSGLPTGGWVTLPEGSRGDEIPIEPLSMGQWASPWHLR